MNKDQKATEETPVICVSLAVKNDSAVEFKQTGMDITSGKAKACNDIEANTVTAPACKALGTDGTWTGLVGYASWIAAVGVNEMAKVTLTFDMSYEGGNKGSLTGDAIFNKYFEITKNIVMPSGDNQALLNAAFRSK